jgi:hypothetical protein
MSMVNLDSYIDSRRTKFIYRIINEPIENWNAIGKYWLSRLDLKFNETFFLCKCFLNLSGMPFLSISNPQYDNKRFFHNSVYLIMNLFE